MMFYILLNTLVLFKEISWMLWYTTIIPVFEKLRQEFHKFKVSLGYITKHLRKKNSKENKKKKVSNVFATKAEPMCASYDINYFKSNSVHRS